MRYVVLTLLYVGPAAYCIAAALQHRDPRPYGLPKALWVIIIALLPFLGAGLWVFLTLRRRPPSGPPSRPLAPDDDPEYLAWLKEQERRRKRES